MTDTLKRYSGFTLMELLAAVTLLAILGTMLFTVFEQSSLVVREASGRQVVFQQAKLFMEHIERELSGAYMNKVGSSAAADKRMKPLRVIQGSDGGYHHIAMTTAAKVRDTRPTSKTYGTEANMGRIGYFLGDGSTHTLTFDVDYDGDDDNVKFTYEINTLYRFEYYALYGSDDDAIEKVKSLVGSYDDETKIATLSPFLVNVVNFNVECFDNGQFNTVEWDSHSSGLPRAMRITLRLTDDKHLPYYDGNDDNGDGIDDDYEETGDKVGQTFQHVIYLGGR